jgi:hypothetical protein
MFPFAIVIQFVLPRDAMRAFPTRHLHATAVKLCTFFQQHLILS